MKQLSQLVLFSIGLLESVLVLCYPLTHTCLYFPLPVFPFFFFLCLFSSLPFFPFSFSPFCTGPTYIAQVDIELLFLLQLPKGWCCRQTPLHGFLSFGSSNFELLKEKHVKPEVATAVAQWVGKGTSCQAWNLRSEPRAHMVGRSSSPKLFSDFTMCTSSNKQKTKGALVAQKYWE